MCELRFWGKQLHNQQIKSVLLRLSAIIFTKVALKALAISFPGLPEVNSTQIENQNQKQ